MIISDPTRNMKNNSSNVCELSVLSIFDAKQFPPDEIVQISEIEPIIIDIFFTNF